MRAKTTKGAAPSAMTATTTRRLALGIGRDRNLFEVASFAQASEVYGRARDLRDASGARGAMREGRVYAIDEGAAPRCVATVSPNGRVWIGPPEQNGVGSTQILLHDPYATPARPRWWEIGRPEDSIKTRARRWVLTMRTKARFRALEAALAPTPATPGEGR